MCLLRMQLTHQPARRTVCQLSGHTECVRNQLRHGCLRSFLELHLIDRNSGRLVRQHDQGYQIRWHIQGMYLPPRDSRKLFANNAQVISMWEAFAGCKSLQRIPTGLFDSMRTLQGVRLLFKNCSSLTGESPYTLISGKKVHLYDVRITRMNSLKSPVTPARLTTVRT